MSNEKLSEKEQEECCCHEHHHDDECCHHHHHDDECCHHHHHDDECCHHHHHDDECCHHEHHHDDECCHHEHHHDDECCHHHHHHDDCCCGHDHGDGCCCGHNHEESSVNIPLFIIAAALFIGCLILEHFTKIPTLMLAGLYLIPYLMVGLGTIRESVHNILHGELFDENFLMTVASLVAFCIGAFEEGVVVMLLFQLGEYLEARAIGKTRSSVRALMDIRPDRANLLLEDGTTKDVYAEDVHPGDTIVVRPGERIPLDGTVCEGDAGIDTAALTGESVPRPVSVGDEVSAGTVCLDSVIKIRVTKEASDSAVSRILEMTEHAQSAKTKEEAFITRFSRVYTPAVVCAAVLLAVIPSVITGDFIVWLHRALTFLVVSCPCALVISVPLSFFVGIGASSSRGVLIKGSAYIEALSKVSIAATDKTGTLTEGRFHIAELLPEAGVSEEDLLAAAAHAESASSHPAARCITDSYRTRTGCAPEEKAVRNVKEFAGKGVSAEWNGHTILVGNAALCAENGISCSKPKASGLLVAVSEDGRFLGWIHMEDRTKEDAKEAIAAFRKLGIREIHMLTGDTEENAKPIADELGIDGCHAALLPGDKLAIAADLKKKTGNGTLLTIGDGINDAPLLASADVGAAMGGLGSDAAMEAADVVIMDDKPSKLAPAIAIAKKTMRIARGNIIFAISVKILIMILGALGITGMWMAIFGDVGVSMICILNTLRILRAPKI